MTAKPPVEIFRPPAPVWIRGALILFVILAIGLLYVSNRYLTARFSETQRNESQLISTFYAGNVRSLLLRQSLVPPLLARDPLLIAALQSRDYAQTSSRLIEFSTETDSLSINLIDLDGRLVATTDRRELGANLSEQAFFNDALREAGTVFTVSSESEGKGAFDFYYSRRILSGIDTVGVVVVGVDMRQIEEGWRRRNERVAITNSQDQVIVASNPFWRHNSLTELVSDQPNSRNVTRALQVPRSTAEDSPYVFINNQPLLRSESKIGFRGWRLTAFTTLEDVRARVNAILALELMVFSLCVAMIFYLISKRLQRQSQLIAEESTQLRSLNDRLSQEIAERQKVEKTLEETEQSLEQASKLAALGQMSAAVSHELNQPLAAMRTYLAGAKLLLQRDRAEEAASSFNRIDDLIERMGAITRQLKSYARKGDDELKPLDLRDSVDSSLSMMSPQLGESEVEIRKTLPTEPVWVLADRVRLEQVIVNLLRNALDAVEGQSNPYIDILLVQGRQVSLSVRDNGTGIEDPENLFEPFYTTKEPGKGVGLGLAISAGIASELGGRLSARNARPTGAVFELQLPRASESAEKAAE